MDFIELFAGIGGFRYGLEAVGDFRCVWANEKDKYANSVYRKNYGKCDSRDIRTVSTSDIPVAEMLVGGFPCQSFSIAGKRGGFEDTRGTLFFEIIRIAQEKRPSILLLENVKGLLNHEQGRTFGTILSALDEIGYNAQWEVLNTKNFGIPQNRERVFIVATLRGKCKREIFPIGEIGSLSDCENKRESKEEKRISSTIDSRYGALRNSGETYIETKKIPQAYRINDIDGSACTLQGLSGGVGAKTGLYAIPLKFLERNQKNYQGDYSFTVDSCNTGGIINNSRIRRLTPVECESLQSFPKNWTKYGHDGSEISDTQRYKMLGNAVSTNVIKVIGEKIKQG